MHLIGCDTAWGLLFQIKIVLYLGGCVNQKQTVISDFWILLLYHLWKQVLSLFQIKPLI